MRSNIKSAFFGTPLVKATQKFVKDFLIPGSAEFPNVPVNKVPRGSKNVSILPSKSRPLNPVHAYILQGFFGTLDEEQRTILARLFPTLSTGQRHLKNLSEKLSLEESSPGYKKKMKSYAQFLTTPTADTPGTSLLLHFEDKRYVIGNIHEGIQRAGIQFGARFTRVRDIFVTGKTEWKTIGGLLGLVITLADSAHAASVALAERARQKLASAELAERARQKLQLPPFEVGKPPPGPSASEIIASGPVMNVHGGPNLMHLFATARRFIFRKGVPLRVREFESHGYDIVNVDRKPDWADSNIQVWNMAITNSAAASSPKSPLKRSFTKFSDHQDQKDKNQELRRHVVSEMFESSWRLDQLEEVPLSQVPGLETAMFIRDSQTKKLRRYFPPSGDDGTPLPDINVLVRKAWPGALIDELPRCESSLIAMSYIIRGHRRRGKFLASKAKELGVTPGPTYGRLIRGESVQSQDGKTITPDMVMENDREGGGIAVIDLPGKEYVENLISRPEWSSETMMAGVGAVIWLLGPGVGQDPQIRMFMSEHPQWKHIISSPDSCPNYLAMSSSAKSAIRLSRINRNFFPIPVHNNNVPSQHGNPIDEKTSAANVVAAQQGLLCQLEPTFEIQDTAVTSFLSSESALETVSQRALDLAQIAKEEIASESSNSNASQDLPSGDAEIITLGTGSALPSKYRNVSATLLRVPGCGSYLLDCGENTLGQLRRVYGDEDLKEVLRDLKLIWISHLHADHHLGTVSVVKAWRDEVHGWERLQNDTQSWDQSQDTSPFSSVDDIANPVKVLEQENRLFIVGTGQMIDWLNEYAGVEDFGLDKTVPLESVAPWSAKSAKFYLKWHHRHVGFSPYYPKINDALRKATGLSDLVACQVPHCKDAQAVSLTFPTGFKFSYSGDCRPCEEFVRIGKGSTVLLHEATFDDERQGDAQAKKHSTTSEAIGVGMAMGAKRIVLTHFSQRYQKIPVMEDMGFMGVRLQGMEETEESEIPIMDADMADSSTRGPQDNSIPQNNETTETSSTLGNIFSNEPSGVTEAANVQSIGSPKTTPIKSDFAFAAIPSTVNDMKVCVAFDYMRVKVKDIAQMEKYTPALLELYQQETEDNVEEEIASIQQVYDEREMKGKRKDESDDEGPRRNDTKKSNEEINRGKSKKVSQKDKSESEQAEEKKTECKEEKDQEEIGEEEKGQRGGGQGDKDQQESGKGAADTNAILLDAHKIFPTKLPLEYYESGNITSADEIEAILQKRASRPENTELVKRCVGHGNRRYDYSQGSCKITNSAIRPTSTDLRNMRIEENAIEVEVQGQEEKPSVVPTSIEVVAGKAKSAKTEMKIRGHSSDSPLPIPDRYLSAQANSAGLHRRRPLTARLQKTRKGLSRKRKIIPKVPSLKMRPGRTGITQSVSSPTVPSLTIRRLRSSIERKHPLSRIYIIPRHPVSESGNTDRGALERSMILKVSEDLNRRSQEQSDQETSIKKSSQSDTSTRKSPGYHQLWENIIGDPQISTSSPRVRRSNRRVSTSNQSQMLVADSTTESGNNSEKDTRQETSVTSPTGPLRPISMGANSPRTSVSYARLHGLQAMRKRSAGPGWDEVLEKVASNIQVDMKHADHLARLKESREDRLEV